MRAAAIVLLSLATLQARLVAAADILYPHGSPAAEATQAAGQGLGPLTWGVALLCAAAGGWLFWKNRGQVAGRSAKGKLSVVETRSLGNRQYLVVAAYGQQKFLIGVCVGRISLLSPLDEGPKQPLS